MTTPMTSGSDWLDDLLAEALVMDDSPIVAYDERDLDVILTGSRGGLSPELIRGW